MAPSFSQFIPKSAQQLSRLTESIGEQFTDSLTSLASAVRPTSELGRLTEGDNRRQRFPFIGNYFSRSTDDNMGNSGLRQAGRSSCPSNSSGMSRQSKSANCFGCNRTLTRAVMRHCAKCLSAYCLVCFETPPTLDCQSQTRPVNCAACRILYCTNLASRDAKRSDLMRLRIKDLNRFIDQNEMSRFGCKEKADLVDLVLAAHPPAVVGETMPDLVANYTSSSSRRQTEDLAALPPSSSLSTFNLPSQSHLLDDEKTDQTESALSSSQSCFQLCETETSYLDTGNEGSESAESENLDRLAVTEDAQPGPSRSVPSTPLASRTADCLDSPSDDVQTSRKRSLSQSSQRRENQKKYSGLVTIEQIDDIDDISTLSVKQMKELLALQRVNLRGVVERCDLEEQCRRVWLQHQRYKQLELRGELADEDLCKICLESPTDCVMLECGHVCTCIKCGKQMNECPMCRRYVVRVVKIFKS